VGLEKKILNNVEEGAECGIRQNDYFLGLLAVGRRKANLWEAAYKGALKMWLTLWAYTGQGLEVWPKSQASAGEPSGEQRANRYL
jgi:hypothetical protein